MLVMTYSDARANFSSLLNRVKTEGAAIIRRADGSSFRITVENEEKNHRLLTESVLYSEQ